MQVEWNKFWCRVLFKEFIRHFRKMSDEQIVADVKQSMDDLEDMVQGSGTFGSKMVGWAAGRADGPFATAARENGKKGGRPRKNPQDAPHGNAGVDRKSATSCDQFTADGDVREDSHDGKSGTSANIYATRQAKNGDAATREGADESTTVSSTFALDMPGPDKGEQPRDSRGSGRYQPPSLGPEDGYLYDQETAIEISTRRRAGGSVRETVDPFPPACQSSAKSGDVLSMAYSGEFSNVILTQAQYNELGIKFGNQQKLNRAIDSLSCKIENGETNPRNHYAELVKWASYREDMEEQKEEENAKPKLSKMEQSWINTFKAIERM